MTLLEVGLIDAAGLSMQPILLRVRVQHFADMNHCIVGILCYILRRG